MKKIHIAHRADLDMDMAWEHIAQQSPATANRWIRGIREKFLFLASHPESGELCPDIGPSIRRLVAGNYAVFYQDSDDFIEIVRVIHAARDIKTAFSE